MNKEQQKAWLEAYISLWNAGAPDSGNNFTNNAEIQDGLSDVLAIFCDVNNLPPLSASELLLHID